MQTQDLGQGRGDAEASIPGPVILLVEDDVAISEMYSLSLRLNGFHVETAGSAADALRTVNRVVPDLVLLDMGLPDRPGVEVLETLKAETRTAAIPVVVLSNYSEPDIVSRALGSGALLYMVKAETTPARVVATVGRLLAVARGLAVGSDRSA